MPRPPNLDGPNPDELVIVAFRIPLWVKRELYGLAKSKGQIPASFFASLFVEIAEDRRAKNLAKRKR